MTNAIRGNWNSSGQWYVQTFEGLPQYFQASGETLKNGNAAGVLVTQKSPRSKFRAKKISVSSMDQHLWSSVAAIDVPGSVQELGKVVNPPMYREDVICAECFRAFKLHAGVRNPHCAPNTCPASATFPSWRANEKQWDAALAKFWTARKTTFTPVI